MANTEIGQTSIPEWNGELASFDEFKENCFWFIRGLRKTDRGLAVPRIIRRLPRTSRQLVRRMNRSRLGSRVGLEYLLGSIQKNLLVPQVQDIGRYIKAYFEEFRIRRNETIQEYCTRERIIYLDMCRAIKALQNPAGLRAGDVDLDLAETDIESEAEVVDDDDYPFPGARTPTGSERGRTGTGSGKGSAKGGKAPRRSTSNKSEWSVISDLDAEAELDSDDKYDVIPNQVQGFYLLRRAGLSKLEEQQVLAAAGNSLLRQDIEKSLRALFWEKKPVIGQRSGHYGEADDGSYDEQSDWGSTASGWDDYNNGYESETSTGYHASGEEWDAGTDYADDEDQPVEDLDEEDRAAYLGAAESLRTGFMQFKTARRTMTQARALMKDIRTGRGFKGKGGKGGKGRPPSNSALASFKGKSKGKGGKGSGKGYAFFKGSSKKGKGKRQATAEDACYLCGGLGHFSRDCTQGGRAGHYADDGSHWTSDEWQSNPWEAGFVAIKVNFTDVEHSTDRAEHGLAFTATQISNRPGLAPIDCGATDSFGGEAAVQSFNNEHKRLYGSDGVSYDFKDRPAYTFGSGQLQPAACRSDCRVWANNVPSTLGVHTFPGAKTVPILVGMNALVKLGAVTDFATGATVFKNINDKNVRRLPRNLNNHLRMDLLQDLAQQGEDLGSIDDYADRAFAAVVAASNSLGGCSSSSSIVPATLAEGFQAASPKEKLPVDSL